MSDPLAPGFLVAVPQLQDLHFRQSVVLMLQQDDDGAMGIVINLESPLLLKDLCNDHEISYAGNPAKRVRRGGPVQPEQGLVLYGAEHSDPEGQPIVDGLYVSASRATLRRLCNVPGGRFQCFSGYAGWGPGQLEQEITKGAWVVAPPDPASVLEAAPSEVWRGTLNALGIDPAALVPGGDAQA